MTPNQTDNLERVIKIIKEGAIRICDDTSYSNADLLSALYHKGFSFIQKYEEQTLVDIGTIGLALLLRNIR